jgi:hypothetical protein
MVTSPATACANCATASTRMGCLQKTGGSLPKYIFVVQSFHWQLTLWRTGKNGTLRVGGTGGTFQETCSAKEAGIQDQTGDS